MKISILSMLLLVVLGCENTTQRQTESVQTAVDSTELEIETSRKLIKNSNLTLLLDNPIDLQGFKNSKDPNYVTTSVINGTDYYYNPKINDSIFYVYNYPTENFVDPRKIDQIVVFKYGENKHRYKDKTEALIEMRIFNKDSDLGKANLVGLTKAQLEADFGVDYLSFEDIIAYSDKNKVLILEIDNSKVKSYKYIKLNTEKIDTTLISRIIK